MRLHHLSLRAFGPFREQTEIDLEQLGASGIFLLEGPTGSGKSTIIDAITYALFGRVASRSGSKMRIASHFAAPDETPEVTLTFSVAGVRYRIRRTPEHERPKRRSAGTTRVAPTVHLERGAGDTWVSMSASFQQVGESIKDIIGLGADQFTQVVVLPQGEFATFLRASDDDRQRVLARLFGVELYDRVISHVEARRVEARGALAEADSEVLRAAAAADQAARPTGSAAPDPSSEQAQHSALDARDTDNTDNTALPTVFLSARDDDDIAARVESLTAALATTAGEAREAARALTDRSTAARSAQDRLLGSCAAWEDLTAAAAILGRAEDEHHERESARTALRRADAAQLLRPQIRAADEALAALERLRATAASTLADCRALLPDGLPDAVALTSAARGVDVLVASLEPDLHLDSGAAPAEAEYARVEAEITVAAAALSEAVRRREQVQARLDELSEQTAALELANTHDDAAGEHERLVGALAAAREGEDLRAELDVARADLSSAVERHHDAVDMHQALVEARLAGMTAELAAGLRPGAPCPVCGSAEHPEPARELGSTAGADVIAVAAEARDSAAARRTDLGAVVGELSTAVRVASVRADDRTVSDLAEAVVTAQEHVAAQRILWESLREMRAESADFHQQLSLSHAAYEELKATLPELRARSTVVAGLVATHRGDLERTRAGHDSVGARIAALRRDATILHRAAAGAADVSEAERTATAFTALAETGVRAAGFDGLADARDALDTAGDLAAGAVQVAAWDAAVGDASARATRATTLLGLDPDSFPPLPTLLVDLERRRTDVAVAATAAAESAAAAHEADLVAHSAAERSAAFAECAQQLVEAVARRRQVREQAQPVLRVDALLRGMEGRPRMRLTTFVLRYWFGQVVDAANVRLGKISAGRYQLERRDQGARDQDRSGLTLSVIDNHTGRERPPDSLSGGETFYTSLALALGLADVVKAEAGGVDLDTLFVDEGFGSLDADTLEEVMTVLDDLRASGRVIGIVSHVPDLKERIPDRLEIRRAPDGSSTARLVA